VILLQIEITGHHHPAGEFTAGESVLGLLALDGGAELYEDLAAAGDLHPGHGAGNLQAAHLPVLPALLPDVLQDVLVLLLVSQLLRNHHVQQAEHLRGRSGASSGNSRHLKVLIQMRTRGRNDGKRKEGGARYSKKTARNSKKLYGKL